ncbi:MAG: hypothetical protein JWN32_1848 [Solirubrobacterales bacterium]|nr:hypothetical protein [Solirubrobacterales bacterium]
MREVPEVRAGVVDVAVKRDFPALALRAILCGGADPRGSRHRHARLDELDDRVRLAAVGGLRTDSVAGAYRAFARQIGLDPDVDLNPLDRAALDRLRSGRFRSGSHLGDALLVAMLETSVPLWALNAPAVRGDLRVLADADGRLAIADDRWPLAALLAPPRSDVAATDGSDRLVVYALRVGSVPLTTIEEAFWHVRASLPGDAR